MEYTEQFPEDSRAERMKNECLRSLKTALPYYDTRTWTKYNRRTVYPNRVGYIRLQIFQMRQLYRMTNDAFFLRQAGIWAAIILGNEQPDIRDWNSFCKGDLGVAGTIDGLLINPDSLPQPKWTGVEKNLIELNLIDRYPWYCIATTDVKHVTTPTNLYVSLDSTNSEVHVLYRYHWDKHLFESEKWQAQNGNSGTEHTFSLSPGFYQFAIIYSLVGTRKELEIYRFDSQSNE
jgi:hypothetical protein